MTPRIGDRASDIWELFCAAKEAGTRFVLRTGVDRRALDGTTTVAAEMDKVPVKGLHRIEVRDKKGKVSAAVLELKVRRLRILPPMGKEKRKSGIPLWI